MPRNDFARVAQHGLEPPFQGCRFRLLGAVHRDLCPLAAEPQVRCSEVTLHIISKSVLSNDHLSEYHVCPRLSGTALKAQFPRSFGTTGARQVERIRMRPSHLELLLPEDQRCKGCDYELLNGEAREEEPVGKRKACQLGVGVGQK